MSGATREAADDCRGKGVIIDLGKSNTICQLAFVADYEWSIGDEDRFDSKREPPRRAYEFDKRTLIVPLSFFKLRWPSGARPVNTGQSTAGRKMASMTIIDLQPVARMRIPHGRFLIPRDQLVDEEIKSRRTLNLEEGIVDRFRVDEEELIDTLASIIRGHFTITTGASHVSFDSTSYFQQLGKVLQDGSSHNILALNLRTKAPGSDTDSEDE